MDFSVIINRLNQLTAFMNNVLANSKKIFELPAETAGEKYVAVWNSVTETTQKMNLSELISYVNSINTRITNYGVIDRDVNEFTFNIGFQWIIEGISYANTTAIVHEIDLAAAGNNRIDIAVLNNSNGIDIITGFETTGTAEQPLPPPDTILLKIFVVDDATIDEEDPPAFVLTVSEFEGINISNVTKIQFTGATVTDDGNGKANVTITGGGGVTVFTELTDVPSTYTGQGTKKVVVKADETGLEFVPDSGGGAVDSVNGQTGVVVLDATDVGAEPTLGFTPENVANKATSLTSPDNTKYPTTQAVDTALRTATFTIELIDELTVDFYAPDDLRINTTTNIVASPTVTLKVNDVAYTLTNLISQGDKITVEASVASVVNLNAVYE